MDAWPGADSASKLKTNQGVRELDSLLDSGAFLRGPVNSNVSLRKYGQEEK
jgi:hypothetical protein